MSPTQRQVTLRGDPAPPAWDFPPRWTAQVWPRYDATCTADCLIQCSTFWSAIGMGLDS
jgi:hypothetical protein